MKKILFVLIAFLPFSCFAQDGQALLDSLLTLQQQFKGVQCSVKVHVDVPGINMPDKNIFVKYEKDKKPVIKSKGLLMLPRKGLYGQMQDLLNTPYQAILLEDDSDTLKYKIVSLDNESDWVTADIYLHKPTMHVHYLDITTREYGSFQIRHYYGQSNFPMKSIVSFESLPAKLPLKFLGRKTKEEMKLSGGDKIKGKIVLNYSEVLFLD